MDLEWQSPRRSIEEFDILASIYVVVHGEQI